MLRMIRVSKQNVRLKALNYRVPFDPERGPSNDGALDSFGHTRRLQTTPERQVADYPGSPGIARSEFERVDRDEALKVQVFQAAMDI